MICSRCSWFNGELSRYNFTTDDKKLLKEVVLKAGDGIVLIHGIHAIKVLEDMQCISVKQGPFLGTEKDKIFV